MARNGFDLTRMEASGELALAIAVERRAGIEALADMLLNRTERRLREGGVTPTPAICRRILTDLGDDFSRLAKDQEDRDNARAGLDLAKACYALALVGDLKRSGAHLTRLGLKEEGMGLFKAARALLPSPR